jgi:hypothetical protein
VPLRLHLHGSARIHRERMRGIDALPHALVHAAGTFGTPRPGAGLLAAAVPQKRTSATQLRTALESSPRVRHRAPMPAAVIDIEGGSEALSEIDFVRLCRRYRMPVPIRQLVRRDRSGRRRYLDATWRRADGRLVVVEIDGALHLIVRPWWDDQLRQNEIVLDDDAILLRYPSIVLRTDERLVVGQLRRALAA